MVIKVQMKPLTNASSPLSTDCILNPEKGKTLDPGAGMAVMALDKKTEPDGP